MFQKILWRWFSFAAVALFSTDILAADPEDHVTEEGAHHFLTLWHDWVLLALVLALVALLIINYYRVKSQRALRESEARFRVLAERSVVGISVVQDGVYKFVNPRLAEMFRCSKEDIEEKKTPLDFVHPDDRSFVEQSMAKRIAGDEEFVHYEARMITVDGDSRQVEVFGSRMIYRGRPAVIATLLDITERKMTEDELARTHSDLRQILDSAAPLLVINRNFDVVRVNDTFCSHVGKHAGDVKGKKCYDVWSSVLCHTPECPLELTLGGQMRTSYEKEHVSADGNKTILAATALPYVDVSGSVQGMIASFSDITELKLREEALRQSEEKSRAQFMSIPVATYIWQYVGDDFVLVDHNDEALEITGGMLPALIGKKLSEAFPERDDWKNDMLRCLKDRTTVRLDKPMPYYYQATGETKQLMISYAYVPPDFVMVHTADITARTEAEEALKESESRFRELAEKAPVGIYLIRDGQVTYTNSAVEEIIGYSVDEILSDENPMELVHPEDRHVTIGYLTSFINGEMDYARYEARVRTKEGTYRDLEISSSMGHYQGAPAIIGTVVDITERKKSEQALRESEDRFKTLAEQSPVGIYVFKDRKFVYMNPKVPEIMGYSPEQLTIEGSAFDACHPDDRPAVNEAMRKFDASDDTSTFLEFRGITNDGTVRHVEIYVSKVIYEGEQSHVGTLVDVSDRIEAQRALLESERKFRALAETTNAAIIIYSQDGMVYNNPAAEAITERTTEELASMAPWEVCRPDYWDLLKDIAMRRLTGEKTMRKSYELPIITKSGKEKWCLYSAESIQFAGKPAVLGTAVDITEHRQAEADLRTAHQERYDQIKQIAGGVAHEIYNALFPAAASIDKLKGRVGNNGDDDGERNVKLLDLAETSVERAIQMTELVTQFSRLESDTETEAIDLAGLFEEILRDRTRIEQLGVALKVDIPGKALVKMNRLHAHSLFTNILNNALDALEDVEERSIVVTADKMSSGVRIEISDSGSGIPPDILPKLFSPFFSTKPRTGTGLGLAICKRITDIYEGKIAVDSALDRGTTFTIFLKT